jgi:hypothetical protein
MKPQFHFDLPVGLGTPPFSCESETAGAEIKHARLHQGHKFHNYVFVVEVKPYYQGYISY